MEINVTGRHFDVSDALKDYVSDKVAIFAEYRKINNVKVILEHEKGRAKAEIIVHGKNINYEAEAEGYDMYRCIDEAVEKMDKQISKYFDKVQQHHKKKTIKDLQT